MIDYTFRSNEKLRTRINHNKESYNSCKLLYSLNIVIANIAAILLQISVLYRNIDNVIIIAFCGK